MTTDPATVPHLSIWLRVLLIATFGALGTLARYGLGELVTKYAPEGFPWGIFVCNCLGCFLFGLVYAAWAHAFPVHPDLRAIVLVGFMGAFTTFSTFAYQSLAMLEKGQVFALASNVVGQVVLGITFAWLGIKLGARITSTA